MKSSHIVFKIKNNLRKNLQAPILDENQKNTMFEYIGAIILVEIVIHTPTHTHTHHDNIFLVSLKIQNEIKKRFRRNDMVRVNRFHLWIWSFFRLGVVRRASFPWSVRPDRRTSTTEYQIFKYDILLLL